MNITRIKVCGITRKIDALDAAGLGVDMLGFVFYNKSKRYVDPSLVRDIVNELPEHIEKVGVFVDQTREDVLSIADEASLTALQFHGNEPPEFCGSFPDDYKVIKAFRLKDRESLKRMNDYDTTYYLLDAFTPDTIGGTGHMFDWKLLKDFEILKPFILAGGLTPDNAGLAVKEISPYGLDVSSGVESSPGKKDLALMKRFFENVRRAE